jgi:hypothetical protein
MKGKLIHNDKGWFISYSEGTDNYIIDVRPNRIDDLNKVGIHLAVNSEVDFMMEDISYFPYRYAVPYIDNPVTQEGPLPTSTIVKPLIRTKKQYKITLWLVGFPDDEVFVTHGIVVLVVIFISIIRMNKQVEEEHFVVIQYKEPHFMK